jgi:hypothetical protein
MKDRLARAGYRLVGKPPAKGAPTKDRLLWLRRYYLRMLALLVPLIVLLVVYPPNRWAWILIGVGALGWVQGFASLSLRIRRETRRGDAPRT